MENSTKPAKRQSIIRTAPRRDFTQIPNDVIRNPNLSRAAKCLLFEMLSYPSDWAFNLAHLRTLSSDGEYATRTAFNELRDAGFVTRTIRRENGRNVGYEYTVFDHQNLAVTDTGTQNTGTWNSRTCKPRDTNTEQSTNTKVKTIVDSENPSAVETREAHRLSAAPTIAQINELIQAWNANRGTLPEVKTVGEARKRKLRSVIKQHNGQAADLIRDATRQVSSNPFWQQNRYTLDNLLAGEKYLGHAEAFRNENEQRIARRNIDTEVPF